MKRLAILAAALLLLTVPVSAQGTARRPGEGDVQRYGGQWRYQHRYWNPAYHVNPSACWEWDSLDGRWEWECE
jgi:hypothetical protein